MLDKAADEAPSQNKHAAPAASLPPPYTCLNRHAAMPDASHDETAHMNFLLNLISHLGSKIAPRMKEVFERRVAPAYAASHGHAPATSQEVRDAMSADPIYQSWSALRRNTQEMRQQVGRRMVFRQLDKVNETAQALNAGSPRLKLDPAVAIPKYVSQVDNHCAPGGYIGEISGEDVSTGACYEVGHFVTAGGGTGAKSDMLGRSMAAFVKAEYPNLNPKRILDVGAGGGFNTLPIAQAFPDAEVIALDVAAPMLRYGHARAQLMDVDNVTFMQADGENLPFEAGHFDLVVTAMVWHETALKAFRRMLSEIHRVLRMGGLALNFEQPNFDPTTPPFERFMRDWDSWYNAEPFWAKLHTLSYPGEMVRAGFAKDKVFERWAAKVAEPNMYPAWVSTVGRHDAEHKMIDTRKTEAGAAKPEQKQAGRLYFFGAVK